ncbi:DUF6328 family protein [Mycolicibacterium austroafricanum]|jgi:hypothetical protein|uniref:DUF6328 family protein n=1 Tax=Mycolicibacterium austroafricanum TaxID=39687 RepID=A0ABT8HPX1_MYCAO|nr:MULTISPECIES: DUF6328 family protein [Mycolicibacterium]MDN4522807.1 DUF6328 family protein [Mycolicibacterium austroafricanum]QRZ06848.1 sodium:proton antiporter [Mycolicibacterium austroafricanum]QZT68330.1 DUF6328 family protein [Mycolicibacterium austroafricanum]UJL30258.1 sodium:proton antiporter [Mycolicibacterium vanbaalenii]WND56658.1 DUF6328 family protein [Mycolicibacterium vanbaalenii]
MTTTLPAAGADWNLAERAETATQRLDRNWACLLQELRVVLTGVQLLTGFLLTLPFQQRFSELDGGLRWLYLATVGCSISATAMLTAPVALHRLVFRRHMLQWLVARSHHLTLVGLVLLGAAVSGVATMIFDVMAGGKAGAAAGAATMAAWLMLWVGLPLMARRGTRADVI